MERERSIFTIVIVVVSTLLFFVWLFSIDWDIQIEPENYTKTSAYVEVTDKGTYPALIGKVSITKYRIVVDVGGEEYQITVPTSIYHNVEIGNEIEVTIFYKDDKIVRVAYGNLEDEDKSTKSVTRSALGAD